MNQENIGDTRKSKSICEPVNPPTNLLKQLSSIIEDFICITHNNQAKRDLDIIKKRYYYCEEKFYSLEEIGIYYDISRERVRQIEAGIIKKLAELMCGSKKNKKFQIQEEIVREYNDVKNILLRRDFILTEEDIRKFFQDRYRTKKSNFFCSFYLLMELLGYCQIPNKIYRCRVSFELAWCRKENFKKAHIERVLRCFNLFLDSSERFDFFEIIIAINKLKGGRLDKDFVKILLKLSNEIEELEGEQDVYQVRFECLPSAAEKAFRVLKENGSPLHFSEVTKIINKAELKQGKGSRITVRNLRNQLIADDRFKPIGRSGIWSLSEWDNISTKTITQIMEDSFHERGEPISAKEVYQYVISKRPDASLKSVNVYLADTDFFVRVDKNKYALVAWGLKSVAKSIRRTPSEASSLIREALEEIFVDKDSMSLADLIRQVKEKTKLAEMTIRTRIKKSQNFELKQESNSNSYTVYCINRNFEKTNVNIGSRKELLRDKIQNEITSILQANPNTPITKGDLYFLVKKEVDCIRPTFYAYLSEMDDIKQYTDNGKSYCLYEYHEQHSAVDIDPALLDSCSDAELLKQLKRAINKLNIDEVDLGLFELGRIFENELKNYLLIAKQNSVIQVYRKDLEKLFRMIDCVVREQVVSKGYYLHILREERNERAHGKIPNLDERKLILNKAHYVAGLYVQNIIFFNNKKNDIFQKFSNNSSA